MGLFSKEKKSYSATLDDIYTSPTIANARIIKNLGVIKVSVSDMISSYKNEGEYLMEEAIKLAKAKGGNAIVNFKYESGILQKNGSAWIAGYIIAYGDAVFIEYND
ncbi:hypothetical protein A3Q29_21435 [Providencia stuartii]|uniref:Heavy metal-binding domain-containing protein n=1 Tax=Providencia stuartii TaxID=588 RepID=A0A1S1HL62_PROST|nr:hypothetical protein A3Q29_21435 [Providencia stuartii]